MPRPKTTSPDFPAGLSAPALRALAGAGYTRLAQLKTVPDAELLALHGFGPKGLRLIRAALNAPAAAPQAPEAREDEPVSDSPKGWVKSHIDDYVATDGQKGHRWRGWPALLLTTRGRKSGQLRRTALIYGRDGANYLLVASNGGAQKHPLWYLNLTAYPEVELQVGAEKLTGRARTATAHEKPRLWQIMTGIYKAYDQYQAKTKRDIPLVIVEPVAAG